MARISVTAFIGKPAPLLNNVFGFKPDPNGTRVITTLRYDGKGDANGGKGNLVAAEAWPWAKLSDDVKKALPIDRFVMCAMVADSFSDEGYRDYVMTCGPDGQLLKASVILFTVTKRVDGKDVNVKEPWVVNVEGPVTQVMAVFDINNEPGWYFDTFTLGESEGARVKIHPETIRWFFPAELKTAALTRNFPSKAEMIEIITDDVNRHCMDKVKKTFFLRMVEIMTVTYMRLFGFKASLPNPEPKTTTAPEAPAPEALATEEPATMPTADEPTPEVSDQETEGEEFGPAQLNLVPDPAPESAPTDGHEIAGRQVDPHRKGDGRIRPSKTAKGKKVKGAKTGTDDE